MNGLMIPTYLDGVFILGDGSVVAPQWLSILLGLFSLLLFIRLDDPTPAGQPIIDTQRSGLLQRRSVSRLPLEVPVEFANARLVGVGLTRDCSEKGVRIRAEEPLNLEEYVTLTLHLPPPEPMLTVDLAVVRWAQAEDVGVEFLSMTPESRTRLHEYLHRTSDGQIDPVP